MSSNHSGNNRDMSALRAYFEKPLNFIDGVRVEPSGPKVVDYEPATGKEICQFPSSGAKDVDDAVQSAKEAFKSWSQLTGNDRARYFLDAAAKLRERKEEFARMESFDQGKPINEARMDVEFSLAILEYLAGLAKDIRGDHIQMPGGSFAIVRREPIGVCAGIGAFNFPLAMAVSKSACSLVCGNTMVYKPSQFTPATTVMLAELYAECGLPPGVFNVVQGEGETGRLLTIHKGVSKVTFTGSLPTGRKVLANCAEGIKGVVLELGGKSPTIIFADADMNNAVKGAMVANFPVQGEVCSNGTRVFVERSIKDDFVRRILERTKVLKVGDPREENTMMGALITKEHRDKVLNYIKGARNEGAKVLYGGEKLKLDDPKLSDGYYVSPCVIDQVTDHMTIAREEVFGPVMSILSFDSEEEVIRRANDTEYGLVASVFTSDLKRAHRVSAQLEAGTVWINNHNVLNPILPFGGYKLSGLGRESGADVIKEYTQLKTVYVEMGDIMAPY